MPSIGPHLVAYGLWLWRISAIAKRSHHSPCLERRDLQASYRCRGGDCGRVGYLSLDDDIRKYLTELPDYGHKVVVRDLVHHVSGLRDFNHLIKLSLMPDLYRDKNSILALISRQRLELRASRRVQLQQLGLSVAREIVERATKRSLQAFAAENIFKPLGMSHTYFAQGAPPDALRAQPYSKTSTGWQPTAQENLITPGPVV